MLSAEGVVLVTGGLSGRGGGGYVISGEGLVISSLTCGHASLPPFSPVFSFSPSVPPSKKKKPSLQLILPTRWTLNPHSTLLPHPPNLLQTQSCPHTSSNASSLTGLSVVCDPHPPLSPPCLVPLAPPPYSLSDPVVWVWRRVSIPSVLSGPCPCLCLSSPQQFGGGGIWGGLGGWGVGVGNGGQAGRVSDPALANRSWVTAWKEAGASQRPTGGEAFTPDYTHLCFLRPTSGHL